MSCLPWTLVSLLGLRRWPGAAFTVTGLLASALATSYVIKTGTAATVADGEAAPRTVVATIAPIDDFAERPVRISSLNAPQAQPRTDLREIVYTVAGNQRPDDPVTVVYADETGTLQTLHNVTLPWSLTVTPVLPVNYVTANSRGSQLNCWITDAAGATVVSQTDFGTSTTCNR